MAFLECRFFSESLGVSTSMNVLLPQAASPSQIGIGGSQRKDAYPVLYLLHGWSDDETIWCRRTSIERYAADLGWIVIMPRVELSYYQNMATGMRFWDLISEEIPALVRQWFPASSRREDTYAAGLSMGGYGAFRLGLACPDKFAAVASLSGALDIRAISQSMKRPDRIQQAKGIFGQDFEGISDEVDLFALASKAKRNGVTLPPMFQWCGTEDFLYDMNVGFRDFAADVELPLEYFEGAGDHSWFHWDREIQSVLRWFNQISTANP